MAADQPRKSHGLPALLICPAESEAFWLSVALYTGPRRPLPNVPNF